MADMVSPDRVLEHKEGHPLPYGVPPIREGEPRYNRALNLAPDKLSGNWRHDRKTKQIEMAERKMLMAAMFCEGKYLRTIAAHFEIDVSTVIKQINDLVADYYAQALKSIGEKIAKEDALLAFVQLEATIAWFDSKKGRIVNMSKRIREVRGGRLGRSKSHGISTGRDGEAIPKMSQKDLKKVLAQDRSRTDIALTAFDEAQDEITALDQTAQANNRDESYQRTEESAGEPAFLRIILECHDKRAKMHKLYSPDHALDAPEELQRLSPQVLYSKLDSLFKVAQTRAGQQQMLNAGSPVQGQTVPSAAPIPATVVMSKPSNNGDGAVSSGPALTITRDGSEAQF